MEDLRVPGLHSPRTTLDSPMISSSAWKDLRNQQLRTGHQRVRTKEEEERDALSLESQFLNTRLFRTLAHWLRKGKCREWNTDLTDAMEQVDGKYEAALHSLMKLADAESVPDMESGWPADQVLRDTNVGDSSDPRLSSTDGLNVKQLETDLKSVLIEKACFFNSLPKGGSAA